jgi:uncharacterized protein YdaU (DUF1376 family)
MNHYPRHVGDFVKDTLGFNQGAIGAYDLLLDAYYANEEAPAVDDVYVIGRATNAAERKNVDRALTKFELRDGRYFHKRVEEELAAFRARSKAGAENAEKRWQKNTKRDAKRMPAASEAQSQGDASEMLASSHKPVKPNPNHQPPPETETAPPNPPPTAGFVVKAPAERISSLAALCSASRVSNATTGSPYVQQWAADGVSDAIVRAAIDEARRVKPHPELIPVKYLVPIVSRIFEASPERVVARFVARGLEEDARAAH